MGKTYDAKDLERILSEVEREFRSDLAKSEDESGNGEAEDEKKEPEKGSEDEGKKDEPKPEGSDSKGDEGKKDGDKPSEEPKAAAGSDDESHDYDDKDLEEMQKMYLSMGKGELRLHKEACEKAYMGKCGEMGPVSKSEAPVAQPAAATPVVAAPSEALAKAEARAEEASKEAAALRKANEELKAQMDLVGGILERMQRRAPKAKAITEIGFVAKGEGVEGEPEPMSKSEVLSRLNSKASDPSLAREDREKINKYCLHGAPVETVRHLLGAR